MAHFETLQDAANANTPAGLDYYWANVDHDAYFNSNRLAQYHEIIAYVIRCYMVRGGQLILDVGCGPGMFLQEFNRYCSGCQLVGMDYAKSAILYAAKLLPDAQFVVDNLVRQVYSNHNCYDLVFCLQSLEHIEEWELALSNLLSMTKPGGHLIITIPNGEFDRLPQHVNRWTFAEFHEILKPYGDVTMRYLGQYSRILGHVRKGHDDKK